jgi:Ala-tRNA(Pro) deacylase
MAVIPANQIVDLPEARLTLEPDQVRMATGDELGKLFPDCELGALVYLDNSLTGADRIAFSAGPHREVLHMKTAGFRHRVQPAVISLMREPVNVHSLRGRARLTFA